MQVDFLARGVIACTFIGALAGIFVAASRTLDAPH
jgi:hypothetical protein